MEGIHWWVLCCISESCIFGHDGLELLHAAYLQCASQVVLEMCGYTWTVYLVYFLNMQQILIIKKMFIGDRAATIN